MPKAGKIPSLFLDANILFSAAYSEEGRSAALFALARQRRCRLVSSAYAVTEAHRNLMDKKPEALKRLPNLLNWVKNVREANASQQEQIMSSGLDPLDVPILAVAINHADILVTGDRAHFGRWMGQTIYGIKICSLADTIEILLP